jgi:predicted glycoside hydrolase/deacetylase ChbG (UPF0249 family)
VKRLIVNADDFGRTRGVNAGVLEAHLSGIVTSATVMVLEPAAEEAIRAALLRAPRLSLGLHFVLTGGGRPASRPEQVPDLAPGGRFRRHPDEFPPELDARQVRRELEAQIARFHELAGKPPSHLDSHHHSALHLSVGAVFAAVAGERRLPARASSPAAREKLRQAGVRTPDHFLDAFFAEGATLVSLHRLIEELPEGTSELMCHPGHADEELLAGSSYAREREREIAALCDPGIRRLLEDRGALLLPFLAL